MTRPVIIAATDLTRQSAHVAGRGARLARKLDADVLLVHVAPEGKAPNTAAQATLSAQAQEISAEARFLSGKPATALSSLAREVGATLLVLGLHRERRALDALRLTTLEQIVLDAPCAALIAHLPPDAPYRQVLTLTDFSDASAQAAVIAARVAPLAQHHAIHALTAPLGALFSPKVRAERQAQAETLRSRFMATPGLPPLVEPVEIIPGGVHEVLRFRAEELGVDLVCLGVHSGKNPKVLGNYTRDLMRAPPTDLLIGRPVPATVAPAQSGQQEG